MTSGFGHGHRGTGQSCLDRRWFGRACGEFERKRCGEGVAGSGGVDDFRGFVCGVVGGCAVVDGDAAVLAEGDDDLGAVHALCKRRGEPGRIVGDGLAVLEEEPGFLLVGDDEVSLGPGQADDVGVGVLDRCRLNDDVRAGFPAEVDGFGDGLGQGLQGREERVGAADRGLGFADRCGGDGDVGRGVGDVAGFPVVADEADADRRRGVLADLNAAGVDTFRGQQREGLAAESIVADRADGGHLRPESCQGHGLVEGLAARGGVDRRNLVVLSPTGQHGRVHHAVGGEGPRDHDADVPLRVG